MLSYDPKKAAEVWQRVKSQASSTPAPVDFKAMIAGEWTDAVTYLHLSRHFRGKESAALRRMAQQEQAHAASLKGISVLRTGHRPSLHTPPAPQQSVRTLLHRCYGRELQCLSQYQAHTADPEYGPIFARLAAQEQEHCHILLQLLGNLK